MKGKDSLTFVLNPKQPVALTAGQRRYCTGALTEESGQCYPGVAGGIKGLANASIQNNSGLPQGLAGLSMAG